MSSNSDSPENALIVSDGVEFREMEESPAPGLIPATVVGTGEKIYLRSIVKLSDADVEEAYPIIDPKSDQPGVGLHFNRQGQEKARQFSQENIDKRVAILAGGRIVCAPYIRSEFGEYSIVSGSLTMEQVEEIARKINKQ